jgi:hypothetical protein
MNLPVSGVKPECAGFEARADGMNTFEQVSSTTGSQRDSVSEFISLKYFLFQE